MHTTILGLALQSIGQLEAAMAEIREALRLQPENANIRNNLGTALRDLGRHEEAEDIWRDVLARDPQNAPAHFNLGTMMLAKGDFAAGWPEFEWRDRVPGSQPRNFAQPRWTGEALDGGVVLIHAEQGFGDTIQFCRYVALAARRARIVLEVPGPLLRLLGDLEGVEQIIARGDALPAFHAHCPMLSLPGVLGTTLDSIPAAIPYLKTPPALNGRHGWIVWPAFAWACAGPAAAPTATTNGDPWPSRIWPILPPCPASHWCRCRKTRRSQCHPNSICMTGPMKFPISPTRRRSSRNSIWSSASIPRLPISPAPSASQSGC